MTAATDTQKIDREKPTDSAWESIGKLLAFAMLIILGTIYYGVVIQQIWAWFIVPAFHVAPLALVTAIGLDLLAAIFKGYTYDPEAKEKELGALIGIGFKRTLVGPSLFLFIGWVAHLIAVAR